jgi:hypothetical protein
MGRNPIREGIEEGVFNVPEKLPDHAYEPDDNPFFTFNPVFLGHVCLPFN